MNKKIKKEQFNKLPWIEKYRPQSLDQIISQKNIIHTLKKFIEQKYLSHLLLYGPPGTGKTSMISACAKELYGDSVNLMVMELNASDDRGIESVRKKIKDFVSSKNMFFGDDNDYKKNMFKLVILDETDAMTGDAQAILRKVVENYTRNARFCLICNYIQKIIPALQSRCTRFKFSPLNKSDIKIKLNDIITKEDINISSKAIDTIIKRSKGDMRKVLNILQSTNMGYDKITSKVINKAIGYPQTEHIIIIINSLMNDSYSDSYNKINSLIKNIGLSLNDIITDIFDIIINFLTTNKSRFKEIKTLSTENIINIIDDLSNIEHYLSVCSSNKIQLGAFVGAFKKNIKKID